MLVKPEDSIAKGKKERALQIIFPKPISRIRANPDLPELVRTKFMHL